MRPGLGPDFPFTGTMAQSEGRAHSLQLIAFLTSFITSSVIISIEIFGGGLLLLCLVRKPFEGANGLTLISVKDGSARLAIPETTSHYFPAGTGSANMRQM